MPLNNQPPDRQPPNHQPLSRQTSQAQDLIALLNACSVPSGICDLSGRWYWLSQQLKQQLDPQQHTHVSQLAHDPLNWDTHWRRVRRNLSYDLPMYHLKPPLQGCMIHTRRFRLPSCDQPLLLVEIQSNQKYHQHFQSLIQQQDAQVRYQHQSLFIARRMQAAVVQSLTDPLTGIANRRAFDQQLQQRWQSCARQGQPLSVLLLDVDFFKDVNDQFGHAHGDDVLKRLARCLADALNRPDDLAARIGGEEFGVILSNTDALGAQTVAAHVLGQVRQLQMPHPTQKVRPYVTVSIGSCTTPALSDDSLNDPNSLLQHADLALYKAKATGRDRCCVGSMPVLLTEPQPHHVINPALNPQAKSR